MTRSAQLQEIKKRGITTQVCVIKKLIFFLLFNSIKNIRFTIATIIISNADNNKLIPQKNKNGVSSEPANGEIVIEEKHNKHSINQPLSNPIIKEEIKEVILFTNFLPSL